MMLASIDLVRVNEKLSTAQMLLLPEGFDIRIISPVLYIAPCSHVHRNQTAVSGRGGFREPQGHTPTHPRPLATKEKSWIRHRVGPIPFGCFIPVRPHPLSPPPPPVPALRCVI